jgi:phosphomannomutase
MLFSEAMPTRYLLGSQDLHAHGGVVITASHNPPDFNGFKIKRRGAAAPRRNNCAG